MFSRPLNGLIPIVKTLNRVNAELITDQKWKCVNASGTKYYTLECVLIIIVKLDIQVWPFLLPQTTERHKAVAELIFLLDRAYHYVGRKSRGMIAPNFLLANIS